MRSKGIFVGLAGGIVLYGLLYYPCYYFLPGQYLDSWFPSNLTLAYVCLSASVLALLIVGILGGRWSGLDGRKTILGGAAAGAIAAVIAYGLILSPATGVIGNKEILRYGLEKVGDDLSLAWLVLYGVSGTLWWGAIGFWACLLPGAVLGGLGGWLAEPVPESKPEWVELFSLIDPVMMFVSLLVLFLIPPVYQGLLEAGRSSVLKYRFSPVHPFDLSIPLIIATSYAWFLFWQLKLWVDLRGYQAVLGVQRLSWVLSSLASLIMSLLLLAVGRMSMGIDGLLFWSGLVSVTVAVLTFWDTFWKKRHLPMPAPQNPLVDLGLIVRGALMLSTFMTMTIMSGNLVIAINLVTITITAIGPLSEGFTARSSSYLDMINLTYSMPRAIFETAFVANSLYLILVLWTLRNSILFLSNYGPRIFRREIQAEPAENEN
jgi:hypothetical protein